MTFPFERVGLVVVALVLCSVQAFAQGGSAAVGYQYSNLSADGEATSLPLGFGVDYSRTISAPWSVVGLFDWSRRSESGDELGLDAHLAATLTSFGGGVRWTTPQTGIIEPFVQVAAGATRVTASLDFAGIEVTDESATKFMVEPAAGVAYKLIGTVAVVAQGSYRRIFSESSGSVFRLFIAARLYWD